MGRSAAPSWYRTPKSASAARPVRAAAARRAGAPSRGWRRLRVQQSDRAVRRQGGRPLRRTGIAISPVGDGSSDYPDLWRVADDGSIEPAAVSGSISAYTPAPGRIWNGTFYRYAVFHDGDIVTLASTKDTADASTAISGWRHSPGAAPVEILKVGDLVDVPTPSGVVAKAVIAIDRIYSIALPPPDGRDTFSTADGAVITGDVKLQDFGSTTVVLRGQAARPDGIFADGVD